MPWRQIDNQPTDIAIGNSLQVLANRMKVPPVGERRGIHVAPCGSQKSMKRFLAIDPINVEKLGLAVDLR